MIALGSKALLTLTGETDSARFRDRDTDVILSEAQLRVFFQTHRHAIRSLVPKALHKHAAVVEHAGRRLAYEIETEQQPSSAWLLAHQNQFTVTTYTDPLGQVFAVPCREVLFLTKKSHIHLNIHFDKNIADFQALGEGLDPARLDALAPYYALRRQEAQARHQQRHPKLNVSNDAFFDRSKSIVGYVFVHDDLHEAVKHFDRPVYEMMKTDLTQAWCDKDLFARMPLATRIKCVQEEAYVIALERYIVLEKGAFQDHFLAYKDALRRICTSLCSGFFREFAQAHHARILAAYDPAFFTRFQQALAAGRIGRMDTCAPERYQVVRERLLTLAG